MMNGEPPSNGILGIGASIGGVMGGVMGTLLSQGSLSIGSQAEESLKGFKAMFGGGDGDGTLGMRVGLAPAGL